MKNNCNRLVTGSWVATVLIGQFLRWESSRTCGELFVKWILVLRLRQIGTGFCFFYTSLMLTRTFWSHSGSNTNTEICISKWVLPPSLEEKIVRSFQKRGTCLCSHCVCLSWGWNKYKLCAGLEAGLLSLTLLWQKFEAELMPEEYFSPLDLFNKIQEQNEELGLIIDLTYTHRYYKAEVSRPSKWKK